MKLEELRTLLGERGYMLGERDQTKTLILYMEEADVQAVEVGGTGLNTRRLHEGWQHQEWIDAGVGERYTDERGTIIFVLYPTERSAGEY